MTIFKAFNNPQKLGLRRPLIKSYLKEGLGASAGFAPNEKEGLAAPLVPLIDLAPNPANPAKALGAASEVAGPRLLAVLILKGFKSYTEVAMRSMRRHRKKSKL